MSGANGMAAPSSELTAPFWEAAAHGRLVRPVCSRCRHSFFTPSWCCPACGAEEWAYEASSGRGLVYSHTTVHRAPEADFPFPVPYVLGIVEVDEGWHLLTRLLVDPPDPREPGALIGLAVQVSFIDEGRPPHRRLPAFAPAAPEPGGSPREAGP